MTLNEHFTHITRVKVVANPSLNVPTGRDHMPGTIVWAMRRARAAGGDLGLCGLQPDVYAMLRMRTDTQIGVLADRAAAVDSWR